ncbi:flagellar basal body P-ring formation protein FlgA [Pseudoxanthomonas daejeonensis]|uniref:flagellar basal body P-ring formation chaperone FlgA n=1 Tax=Pseudoxanthomonas daejeonensis TaxID=266062 RepID=UPI001F54753A|nr:flagellar basal body P-ring formation chaperone FlgA [Pseudoxanthomonas daejeonensis]UNK59146.1 flagellar basal body P-ring formation protein FlgA [Pseudoxanthomonas daejeonensis]
MLMFLLALPMTVALAAGGFQPVESIRAAALGAVPGGQAEASLDPALRMPACAQALQAQQATAGTVEVACPDGWRLFVPVKLRRTQPVLVLARGVAAGEPIPADALATETRDTSRIAGAALSDAGQAVGQVARRVLPAGTVLSAGDLVAPRLVRRGDQVALVSRRGGVEVRVSGRALGDAGENERVAVENLSSRRVLQGRVGPGGEVLVTR